MKIKDMEQLRFHDFDEELKQHNAIIELKMETLSKIPYLDLIRLYYTYYGKELNYIIENNKIIFPFNDNEINDFYNILNENGELNKYKQNF